MQMILALTEKFQRINWGKIRKDPNCKASVGAIRVSRKLTTALTNKHREKIAKPEVRAERFHHRGGNGGRGEVHAGDDIDSSGKSREKRIQHFLVWRGPI